MILRFPEFSVSPTYSYTCPSLLIQSRVSCYPQLDESFYTCYSYLRNPTFTISLSLSLFLLYKILSLSLLLLLSLYLRLASANTTSLSSSLLKAWSFFRSLSLQLIFKILLNYMIILYIPTCTMICLILKQNFLWQYSWWMKEY